MSDDEQTESSAEEVATSIERARAALPNDVDLSGAYSLLAIAEAMTRLVEKIDRLTSPKNWRRAK